MSEEQKPSILDQVMHAREATVKKKYGVSKLDMTVLEKIIPQGDLQDLMVRYRKNVDLASAWGRRIRPPKPAQRALFVEHLTFPGTLAEFAREKKVHPIEMQRILTKVAYYEYVVERKHLPTPKVQL